MIPQATRAVLDGANVASPSLAPAIWVAALPATRKSSTKVNGGLEMADLVPGNTGQRFGPTVI